MPAEDDVSLFSASCLDETFSVGLIIGSIDAVAVSFLISFVVTFDEESQI